jgi:hypothetical protein
VLVFDQSVIEMRSILVATVAFLGRIDSETRCAFWCDEPVDRAFDPARLLLRYSPKEGGTFGPQPQLHVKHESVQLR